MREVPLQDQKVNEHELNEREEKKESIASHTESLSIDCIRMGPGVLRRSQTALPSSPSHLISYLCLLPECLNSHLLMTRKVGLAAPTACPKSNNPNRKIFVL
jgi:hypothetical protein